MPLPHFDSLWVIPATRLPDPLEPVHTEACYNARAARAHVAHRNKVDNQVVATWRLTYGKPVKFSRTKPTQPIKTRFDVPLAMWVVIDKSNGSYYDFKDGFCWVFCFNTKAAAKKYVTNLRKIKDIDRKPVIEVSDPIRMYQG